MALFATVCTALSVTGCGGQHRAVQGPDAAATNRASGHEAGIIGALPTDIDAMRSACAARINDYRTTVGLPALALQPVAGHCADGQVLADQQAATPHAHFGACHEEGQDECMNWSGSPSANLDRCLAQMWAEGPGGGHYEIMTNGDYKTVDCGFASVDDQWWMVQNFYR